MLPYFTLRVVMAVSYVLIALALIGPSVAVEDSGMSNIDLAFWKNSGFNTYFANSTAMIQKILTDQQNIRNSVIDPVINAVVSGDSNFKNMGTEDITTIEREGVNALGAMMPHAGCALYDEVIDVPNADPNAAIYPSCVVVKRCGGCCGHPVLACRPTSTETVKVQVMKYIYDGSMRPSSVLTHLELESHTSCQCGCKVQASDCNPQLHDYSDYSCECVCKNQALAGSCQQGTRWNSQYCACQCADIQNCGAGYYYDMISCSCRVGIGNSGSNPILPSGPERAVIPAEPDQEVTEQVTQDPCPHLSCSRNYKAMVLNGRCRCRYIRNSSRSRNGR